jgi:membrane protein required for colicin V production
VEVLAELSWIDLLLVVVLAVGVFAGFTQGLIRYVLNAVAVIVAFVVAAQLKAPLLALLGFWTAFSPEVRELLLFLVLFVGLVIGGWFVIRAFYRRTRLPIVRQLDEIGGAIFGLIFAAMVVTFHLLVLDSLFADPIGGTIGGAAGLKGYYDALNDSLLVGVFRDTLIPTAGLLARPFVPPDIRTLLLR